MKDLPVRTLIAVLLIGLLCLVVCSGAGFRRLFSDFSQLQLSMKRSRSLSKEEFAPPCFRKFCSAAQCSP